MSSVNNSRAASPFANPQIPYMYSTLDPEPYNSCQKLHISEEVSGLFRKHVPNYQFLPRVNLKSEDCLENGFLHLKPSDLKGYCAVKGKDCYGRQYVAYLTYSKTKKYLYVQTLFQLSVDNPMIMSSCYGKGVLGHNQLFSSTPKIEDIKPTIQSLLDGTHGEWKLKNRLTRM